METIDVILMALTLGAASGLKDTTQQVVTDLYGGLKDLIKRKYSKVHLELLEDNPNSESRKSVIQEDLIKLDIDKDLEILAQSKKLLDAISSYEPNIPTSIGVALEDVKAASLRIADITAKGNSIGVQVKGANIDGDVSITNVNAQGESSNFKKKLNATNNGEPVAIQVEKSKIGRDLNVGVFGLPVQGIFKALLITFLLLQLLSLLWLACLSATSSDTSLQRITLGMCCPLIFGVPSVFGFILGLQSKDKRLIQLSVITGISSLLPTLYCLSPLIIAFFLVMAEKLGFPAYK